MKISIEERFFIKVEKGQSCWNWIAAQTRRGYGKFSVDGLMLRAHRFSYERFCGDIPDGMLVCHTCDNPSCVRPEHLFLGTNADNVADKCSKGRQCRGVTHGRAKLTEADVRVIRLDPRSIRIVAADFGVDCSLISRVRNFKAWSHIS
jgi:hypothetical protein